jgi:hypothetical protein
VSDLHTLTELKTIIGRLGATALLSNEQWHALDKRLRSAHGVGSSGYAEFYSVNILDALSTDQMNHLAQGWGDHNGFTADRLAKWSAIKVNSMLPDVVGRLFDTAAWQAWGQKNAFSDLSAAVINGMSPAAWVHIDNSIDPSDTDMNGWSSWIDKGADGHFLEQLSANVLAHILNSSSARMSDMQLRIKSMTAAEWSQVAHNGGGGLAVLSNETVASFSPELLTELSQRAISQITAIQWKTWNRSGVGLLDLAPKVVNSLNPSVIQSTVGSGNAHLGEAFTVTQWQSLAEARGLSSLSTSVTSYFSSALLNSLANSGNTHTDHTMGLTAAQWFAWKTVNGSPDGSVSGSGLSPLLQTRLNAAMGTSSNPKLWEDYQAALAKFHNQEQAVRFRGWVIDQGDLAAMQSFVQTFTELTTGLQIADQQAMVGMLNQATDAASARGVLWIAKYLHTAYPAFSLAELSNGLTSVADPDGSNRVLDILSAGAADAGLDAADFRSRWAELLDAAPAGLTRLALIAHVTHTSPSLKKDLTVDIRNLKGTSGELRSALAELREATAENGLNIFQQVTNDIANAAGTLKGIYDNSSRVSGIITGFAFGFRHMLNILQTSADRTTAEIRDFLHKQIAKSSAVRPVNDIPVALPDLINHANGVMGLDQERMPEIMRNVMKPGFSFSNSGLRYLLTVGFEDRPLFRGPRGDSIEPSVLPDALSAAVAELATYKSILNSPKYRGDPKTSVVVPAGEATEAFTIPAVNSKDYKTASVDDLKKWATYLYSKPNGDGYSHINERSVTALNEASSTRDRYISAAIHLADAEASEQREARITELNSKLNAANIQAENDRLAQITVINEDINLRARIKRDQDIQAANLKFDQVNAALVEEIHEEAETLLNKLIREPHESTRHKIQQRFIQWQESLSSIKKFAMQLFGSQSTRLIENEFMRDQERNRIVEDDARRAADIFRSEKLISLHKDAINKPVTTPGGTSATSYLEDITRASQEYEQATTRLVIDQAVLDRINTEHELSLKDARARYDKELGEMQEAIRIKSEQSKETAKTLAQKIFQESETKIQNDNDVASREQLLLEITKSAPLAGKDQIELYALLKKIKYNQAVSAEVLFMRNAYQGQRLLASVVFGIPETWQMRDQLLRTSDKKEALAMRTANFYASLSSTMNMPMNWLLSGFANFHKGQVEESGKRIWEPWTDLLKEYFPVLKEQRDRYRELHRNTVNAQREAMNSYMVTVTDSGNRVIVIRNRIPSSTTAMSAQQMAQEIDAEIEIIRSHGENHAFRRKVGRDLFWGILKNAAAFANDSTQAYASYMTLQYAMSDQVPEGDYRKSHWYQAWLATTVVGNGAMAIADAMDAVATGYVQSRYSLYANLLGNANNTAFGICVAFAAVHARHAGGLTNAQEYEMELTALRSRTAIQVGAMGVNFVVSAVLGPVSLPAHVFSLLLLPAITFLAAAALGPDITGYQRATAMREYAKTLACEVDAEIYGLLADRAYWNAPGAAVLGGYVNRADAARFYEQHQISANGNYIRRGAIQRMTALAEGRSLSGENPEVRDLRILNALTNIADSLERVSFAYGQLVFLAALTQRFKIGSENTVSASGVFELDYHPMQGAIAQPYVTLDTGNMQANSSVGWRGNGWAGNATPSSEVTPGVAAAESDWLGISNGMARDVSNLATVIKPHVTDLSKPAVVVFGRGSTADRDYDYKGTVYIDARDLPEGSLIILLDPSDENIKVITNSVPGRLQDIIVDQKSADDASEPVREVKQRTTVEWSSPAGESFRVNLDAFGDNLLLKGGAGNEILFGEADDLQYMYGGGDVSLSLSGANNQMYVGVGANALLLGNENCLLINSDRRTERVGQFASFGTANTLDFENNQHGLVFSNYAGVIDISRNQSGVSSSPMPVSDEPIAQVRGFNAIRGTQGRDHFMVVGAQAGSQHGLNLFGGDGENTYDINTSSGLTIALGRGRNTVNLTNALAITIDTLPETASSAELFLPGAVYQSNSIYLMDYSYLTATLRGVDSVFMSDSTASEANLTVDGGIHNISLRGQVLALYVDGTEYSTTYVSNYLRDAEGRAVDEAEELQYVNIEDRNDTRIAICYDRAAKILHLATFSDNDQLLSEIELAGNVDEDMVIQYDSLVRTAGGEFAMGSVVQATVAANVLVDALAYADESVFMEVTNRQNTTRSMAWLSNIVQFA